MPGRQYAGGMQVNRLHAADAYARMLLTIRASRLILAASKFRAPILQ